MTVVIHIHGPVTVTCSSSTDHLGEIMSALTDAVNAEVAADNAAIVALNDLAAKVAAGTATAADAQAAVDALTASQANLSAAVASDDPAPAAPVDGTPIP